MAMRLAQKGKPSDGQLAGACLIRFKGDL